MPAVNVVVTNSVVSFFFSFCSVSYSVHVSEDYPGTVQCSCLWHVSACYRNLLYSDENIWKGVDVFQVHPCANHFPLVRLFSHSFLPFRRHLSAGSGRENLVHRFTETGACDAFRVWGQRWSQCESARFLFGMVEKAWSFKRLSSLARGQQSTSALDLNEAPHVLQAQPVDCSLMLLGVSGSQGFVRGYVFGNASVPNCSPLLSPASSFTLRAGLGKAFVRTVWTRGLIHTKVNQARAKASFQLVYVPTFLHKETAQIPQVAQELAGTGEREGDEGRQALCQ